jgi:hypothetical protein
MSVKIKKISIHAFRGIPDLELELEGKSLLLRGENGVHYLILTIKNKSIKRLWSRWFGVENKHI